MTPEQFTDKLPDFVSKELGIKPPLTFRKVSARVFPLRANLDVLQQLCNSFLNIIPQEAGYFRAPMPYVFLVVLDYGQMGEEQMRAGWFSQVEVYFGVPVEWYRWEGGRWVFQDWAVITPYIFVNDDVSVPVGRTVYGFPKILAKVESTPSLWIKNPLAPTTLAQISTKVFPEVFMGGKLESRIFLEVEQAAMSHFRAPFDASAPAMPWTVASNLASAFGGFGRDAWWLAQGMRICPIIPSAGGPEIIPEMLARVMQCFAPGEDGFVLNSLNLKQFRQENDPTKICYRALTNGRMMTTAVNGAGLLGENRIMLGDLSGGFSISLYEHASLPIARVLGLEVNSSWTSGGVRVDEFLPVMPHWIDVNLKFDNGTNIAWQKSDGIWRNETGIPFGVAPDKDFNNTISTAIEAISGPFHFPGTTIRVIPLLAEKQKLQQFLDKYGNGPLKDRIVNEDGSEWEYQIHFKLWARETQASDADGTETCGKFAYVYLAPSNFTTVISQTNNVGDWAKDELSFLIPVKFQRTPIRKGSQNPSHDDKWETLGVGLVPAFTLVDNCITAFTRWEIQGIMAMTANFPPPETVWLDEIGAKQPRQTLLRAEVETLSALGKGQEAKFQPVIEISQNDSDHGFGNVPDVASQWARDLGGELACKKAAKQQHSKELNIGRALSIELLGSEKPFSLYTLKQFRDVRDPDKACFQALVRVPRKLIEVFDVREIEKTIVVHLYGYPPLNIVEELGLHATPMADRAAGVVYSMQGLRPFYIRATLEESAPECLLSRSGTFPWTLNSAALNTTLGEGKDSVPIIVDLEAEKLQDLADPSHTAETMVKARQRSAFRERLAAMKTSQQEANRRTSSTGAGKNANDNESPSDEVIARAMRDTISVEEARHAIDVLDPQIIIESILSREWSNSDPKARWRIGKQELIRQFCELPVDGKLKPYAESELYRQTNNKLAARVGAVARSILRQELNNRPDTGEAAGWRKDLKAIILRQNEFTRLGDQIEECVNELSPLSILGIDGLKCAYATVGEILTPDEVAGLALKLGGTLVALLRENAEKEVVCGFQSSDCEGVQARDQDQRMKQILDTLNREFRDEIDPNNPLLARLEKEMKHSDEVAELVNLARLKRQRQVEALLNKLSKAYQKPDFCLLREGFRAEDRDKLVPIEQSWDEHWYHGPEIK